MSRSGDRKLGRMALLNDLLTPEQLEECLKAQRDSDTPQPLGVILLRKGYLDDEQLQTLSELEARQTEAVTEIRDVLLCLLLIDRQQIDPAALVEGLRVHAQRAAAGRPLRVAEVLTESGNLSAADARTLAQDPAVQRLPCDRCEASISIEDAQPGSRIPCPRCSAETAVPTLAQVLHDLDKLVAGGHEVIRATTSRRKRGPGSPRARTTGRKKRGKRRTTSKKELSTEKSTVDRRPTPPPTPKPRPSVLDEPDPVPSGGQENRIGEYVVLEEIAQGGMGIVYKARQLGLNRIVALKVLKDKLEAKSESVLRFHREARAASRMNHPNIVSIIEVGNADGLHFLTMDFIEGTPLDEVIENEERVDPKRAIGVMAKIADAIHYAHSCNVVHRDLKPSNIILDEDDEPHITDFGLAKRLDSKSRLTETGALVGTPYYMAPEQISEGGTKVKKSWDLYALGVILYEMLTGRLPFNGETTMEVYHQILNHNAPRPRQVVRSIPPAVERICLKTLEREEALRYRSVGEMLWDLRAYQQGRPISARPLGRFGRAVRRYEKHTFLYTVIICSLLIALGTAIILCIRKYRQSNAAVAPPARHAMLDSHR